MIDYIMLLELPEQLLLLAFVLYFVGCIKSHFDKKKQIKKVKEDLEFLLEKSLSKDNFISELQKENEELILLINQHAQKQESQDEQLNIYRESVSNLRAELSDMRLQRDKATHLETKKLQPNKTKKAKK